MSNNTSGFLGCGTVFIAPFVSGKPTQQWYDLDEVQKFEIKENTSEKERKSGRCDTLGQLKDQVVLHEPADLSIAFSTINKDSIGLLLLADSVDVDIAAGTFTNEVIRVKKGRSVILPQQNIKTLEVTNDTQTTTYVEGTDYKITNAGLGMVLILETGNIDDDKHAVFSGTTGSVKKTTINGGSSFNKRVSVMLVGKNQVTGENVTCYIEDVRLQSQSGVDFLADDFISGDVSGKPVIGATSGKTYEVELGHKFG